jgi:DNA replication licensing factor MCM2
MTVMNIIFSHGADTDEDTNFRRPKRHRASFRPPSGPRTPRSDDDGDGATPSSPGQSQRGYSGGDVPMTDQTDDDPYEVLSY